MSQPATAQQPQPPKTPPPTAAQREALALKSEVGTVAAALEQMRGQIERALPQHLTADRMLRVCLTAITRTPKLLKCNRNSLYMAILSAAQLGLEPDGVLGQAYLVPFKDVVQLIPGYKGYIALAQNSGQVLSWAAHEVCEKDHFDYRYGLEPKLNHVPANGDRGEVTHFYSVALLKGGGRAFEVMTRAEVEAIRDTRSQGYRAFKAGQIKETPWATDFVQMGRKTALLRLKNYMPLSVQRAAALEDAYEDGKHAELGAAGELVIEADFEDVTEASKPTGDAPAPGSGAASASRMDKITQEAKPGPAAGAAQTSEPAPAAQAAPAPPIAPEPAQAPAEAKAPPTEAPPSPGAPQPVSDRPVSEPLIDKDELEDLIALADQHLGNLQGEVMLRGWVNNSYQCRLQKLAKRHLANVIQWIQQEGQRQKALSAE